ncbi:hypothetical protein KR093_004467, partial [Drosophila rubida]
YRWSTATYNFFKDRGIEYDKPIPYVGSMRKLFFGQSSMMDLIIELYNKNDSKVYGVFEQRTPMLMIKDPELLKQITIKDFDHFLNHRDAFSVDEDDNVNNMFGSSLFSMRDARWRDMRSTLSPAFTGSKMRQMFQLMDTVANEAVQCLNRDGIPEDGLELDVKDFCARFTNDVIESTVFAQQVNSFKDRENTFYLNSKKMTDFTCLETMKFLLYTTSKRLFKLLKLPLFDVKSTDYLVSLVTGAMKYRQEHNFVRPDMIQMLMEASGMVQTAAHKPVRDWKQHELLGQCFVFFMAGFETTAVTICFTAHEIMENEDVQKKLYEEVCQVNSDLDGGQLTYEALMGMKYLDQVVTEVMRKWPAVAAIDRECSKDITYVVDGKNVEIKKGDTIWLPVAAVQRDPRYFENPEKFDPERFSDENKHKIQPYTYYPFGSGPRNCIGSRFALLESKAVIYYMLRDFRIAPSEKSCIPMVLVPYGYQLKPKNGFWLKLFPRN